MGQTVEQALEKAAREGGKKIVNPMIDVLQKHWMDQQQNGAMYTIIIDEWMEPEEIARFTEMFENSRWQPVPRRSNPVAARPPLKPPTKASVTSLTVM